MSRPKRPGRPAKKHYTLKIFRCTPPPPKKFRRGSSVLVFFTESFFFKKFYLVPGPTAAPVAAENRR